LDFLQTTKEFAGVTSRVANQQTSSNGSTTKLAVELQDGHVVESVIMRYDRQRRVALCVSSQSGCAMGCTFCATGTMGFLGNLSAGEILEQVVHANKILSREWQQQQRAVSEGQRRSSLTDGGGRKSKKRKNDAEYYLVRNVVFMGMGEPLDNYNAVVQACSALMDPKRWNLAKGKITVRVV